MNIFWFLIAMMSVFLTALAQISLRKTMLSVGTFNINAPSITYFINIVINPWFLLGFSCYVLSICMWMGVLSKVQVSLAYPLSSFGYIIVAVAGYYFLNENLTTFRMGGIALICIGVMVLVWRG